MTRMVTVRVHLPDEGRAVDVSRIRTALVADVLARFVEMRGGSAYLVLVPPVRSTADRLPALREQLADLWIRAPEPDGASLPGSVADVVGPAGAVYPVSGARYDVASAVVEVYPIHDDPLVLRLALLSAPSDRELTLGHGAIDDAADTLERWRDAVASWAEQPSVPAPKNAVVALREALADGLDTAALIAGLREAEAADLTPGAKFELFAYADRVLGIDLARQVGRPSRRSQSSQ